MNPSGIYYISEMFSVLFTSAIVKKIQGVMYNLSTATEDLNQSLIQVSQELSVSSFPNIVNGMSTRSQSNSDLSQMVDDVFAIPVSLSYLPAPDLPCSANDFVCLFITPSN
jgi:hypothetical protein